MADHDVHRPAVGAPHRGTLGEARRWLSNLQVRLADVLHRGLTAEALYLVLAAIAAWKAFEIAVLGHPLVAVPVLASGGLILLHRRAGASLLAVVCLSIVLTPTIYSQPSVNHLTWVFWTSLTMALFAGAQQRYLLRWQLTIMYGFAAIAKVWPDFLSGAALENRTWIGGVAPLWLLIFLSWTTLFVEAGLALGAWSWDVWWRISVWAAVGLHVSFLLFTVTGPWRIGRLLIFGGLTIALWLRVGPRDATPPTP
jgi:hypothetical protein